MAMTEELRLELYEALKEVLGVGPATTFMEAMPPVGWADVATKRDVDHLRIELGAEFRAELHREVAVVHRSIADLQRTLFFSLLGAQTTLAGLLAGLILAVR